MGKISLEGLDFFAYHGVSEEERRIGNKYTIDIEISADFGAAALGDSLNDTIDYSLVYAIVKDEVMISSKLLENVAKRISLKIFKEFSQVEKLSINVSKHNPPIGGVCTRAKINLTEKRSDKQVAGSNEIDQFYGLPEAPNRKEIITYDNPLDLNSKDQELSFLDNME